MVEAAQTPTAPPAAAPVPPLRSARSRKVWTGLFLALVLLVCTLAFSPDPPAAVDTGWDKANHLLAFTALAFCAEFAFWPLPARRWRIVAGLLALGSFIEVVQTTIPGRSGEVTDLLADAAGIAVGLMLAALASTGLGWLDRRRP